MACGGSPRCVGMGWDLPERVCTVCNHSRWRVRRCACVRRGLFLAAGSAGMPRALSADAPDTCKCLPCAAAAAGDPLVSNDALREQLPLCIRQCTNLCALNLNYTETTYVPAG